MLPWPHAGESVTASPVTVLREDGVGGPARPVLQRRRTAADMDASETAELSLSYAPGFFTKQLLSDLVYV